MKPTRAAMKALLQSDEEKVLKDTWYEYSEDQPLPTKNRDELIDAILDLMEQEGDVIPDELQYFKLSDLAREMGIDPKVARDKYRKALKKGEAPESSSTTGWIFEMEKKPKIVEAIRLRRKA